MKLQNYIKIYFGTENCVILRKILKNMQFYLASILLGTEWICIFLYMYPVYSHHCVKYARIRVFADPNFPV